MKEAEKIVALLKEKQATLTFAESLTCGLAAATLGEVSGVSAVFKGSFVTYSASSKENMGVDATIIEQKGVVSQDCAKAMAQASKEQLGSEYALSFTGVAGPDLLEGQAVGTVWIGLATPTDIQAKCYHFKGDRNEIRTQSVAAGFLWLEKSLNT